MRQIVEITGVGEVLAAACAEKGFRSVEDIAMAKVADLVAVPGVSIIRANQLIQAAQGLLRNASQPDAVRAGDDAVTPSADTHPQEGDVSPPAARITNGAGDQAGSTQSADKVSASSQTAASSMRTTEKPKPVAPAKAANASLEQTESTHRETAGKKKKQESKTSKKKRTGKIRQSKKSTEKKLDKKNKKKKSKKNNNKKNSKKDKSRRKKKSGKSK